MQGNRRTTTKKSGVCKFHVPKLVWITIFNLRFEAVIFLYLFKKKNIWDNKLLKSGVATTTQTYQLLLTKVHVKAFWWCFLIKQQKSSSIFPSPPFGFLGGPPDRWDGIIASSQWSRQSLPTSIMAFQVAEIAVKKLRGGVYLILYHVFLWCKIPVVLPF